MDAGTRGVRVWLPNCASHHDYSDAEVYGTLCPITEGRVNIFRISEVASFFKDKLADAAEGDWVLVSGYPVLNSIAIYYFLKKYGHCNILQWGALKREYVKLQLFDPFDA